jgi:hypothetical protein
LSARINKKYKPLWSAKYRYAIISGGRGSAKSYTVQSFLRDLTYEAGHKIIATRYTMTSAKKSVIPEFASKLSAAKSPYSSNNMDDDFELIENTYTNKRSQSEIAFMGLKTSSGIQTASLKSIEGLTTWSMEEAEELIDDGTETEANTFDKIDDSLRKKGSHLRTILTWNPSNEDSFIYKRFFKDRGVDITFNGLIGDVLYIYTTYEDNLENLNQSFIDKAEQVKASNKPRYDHIYLGIPIKENALALWKKNTMLAPYRVSSRPEELKRIVVAVDPSVTSTGHQDECGIMIGAEDHRGHYYILRDDSGIMDPLTWARATVGAYHDFQCDKIVAEVNQGFDLVKITIGTVEKNLPVESVIATRGKMLRAEPVAALYEEGRVHHVGQFPELEQEMTEYTGAKKDKSPNRLDALVWLLTDLANLKTKQEARLFIGSV